jgi:hypothetical protein
VTRIVDRGAIFAAYVGIGMAATMAISFLLVIPIEPIYWALSIPAGLLIGYYANQRSDRRAGPWLRIGANGLVAGVTTGITLAVLLLLVKAIFFFADTGYPDFNRVDAANNPIPPYCGTGADCVYQRYLAQGRGAGLQGAGVTDAGSFAGFYWNQQLATAGLLLGMASASAIVGAGLYGIVRPRPLAPRSADAASS